MPTAFIVQLYRLKMMTNTVAGLDDDDDNDNNNNGMKVLSISFDKGFWIKVPIVFGW